MPYMSAWRKKSWGKSRSISWLLTESNCVLVCFSGAMKNTDQINKGEERVYFSLQSHHWEKSGKELKAGTETETCCLTVFLGDVSTCLFTQDMELMTDQSMITVKSTLVSQWVLLGLRTGLDNQCAMCVLYLVRHHQWVTQLAFHQAHTLGKLTIRKIAAHTGTPSHSWYCLFIPLCKYCYWGLPCWDGVKEPESHIILPRTSLQ